MGHFSKNSAADESQDGETPGQTLASTILQKSLVDSQLLMMTAAERGIEIDEDVTRTILETSDAFDKAILTSDVINSFWHAYKTLSRTLRDRKSTRLNSSH